jgi:prevent-host-death family protein
MRRKGLAEKLVPFSLQKLYNTYNMYYMENFKLPDVQFSASDLQRQTDDVTHAASRAPITITKRGKARFVMMSVDDYAALQQQRDNKDVQLVRLAAEMAAPAFAEVWDNSDDEVYDAL